MIDIVNKAVVKPKSYLTHITTGAERVLFLLPGHDFDRCPSGRGLRVAGAAWRWGRSPAARSTGHSAQARLLRSRRASFHGRRQAGRRGEKPLAVRGGTVPRALVTPFRWIGSFHAHSNQARRKWQGCACGKHGLAYQRSAFRTCAAGCESPCLRRYVGPARSCAPPMRTPQPGGPGSSILGPAGRWPPGCRFGLSFIGLPGPLLRCAPGPVRPLELGLPLLLRASSPPTRTLAQPPPSPQPWPPSGVHFHPLTRPFASFLPSPVCLCQVW